MSNIFDLDLSLFLIKLQDKKTKELYKILSEYLDEVLVFMTTQYVKNSDKNEYELKHKNLFTDGYRYVVKINSLLELLIVSDESQTNKYKFEECLTYHMRSAGYATVLLSIDIQDYDLELKSIKECSDLKNEEQINEYKEIIRKKSNYNFLDKINSFNSLINDYILCIVKIKTALKNFYL